MLFSQFGGFSSGVSCGFHTTAVWLRARAENLSTLRGTIRRDVMNRPYYYTGAGEFPNDPRRMKTKGSAGKKSSEREDVPAPPPEPPAKASSEA